MLKIKNYPLVRVGFVGEMGSGKSTCAQALANMYQKKYNHNVDVTSFAGPVRRFFSELFYRNQDFDDPEMYIKNNKFKRQVRNGMQYVGDELGRGLFGQDYWIEQFPYWVKRDLKQCSIVDDVRYPNEVKFLRSIGFTIIHIVRDPLDRLEYVRNQARKQNEDLTVEEVEELIRSWQRHPSESQIKDLDIDASVEYNSFTTWMDTVYGNV